LDLLAEKLPVSEDIDFERVDEHVLVAENE
jgi:hypothetical protein